MKHYPKSSNDSSRSDYNFPYPGCTKSETTINEYRVAGKKAELRVLAEALLNRGNVVRRNIVAGELVHKPRSEIVLASSRPATPL